MSNKSFGLKSYDNIFTPTDPTGKTKSDTVFKLELSKLRPFNGHPFKLYEGQRFDDMVESVIANGVLVPIIVRPINDADYEILSGHNRVEASKAAGLDCVPAIVREGLTDDDALLIVTETNLIQRSFADMSHSERAVTLSAHHEAIKRQGKRTDLIKEIEIMVNTSNINGSETSSPMAIKLTSIEKIGMEYALSKDSVARYLRVNRLIQSHKARLDKNELSIRAAVTLSYLTEDEQQIVENVLSSGDFKLDMRKADALRQLSAKSKLTETAADEIISGKGRVKKASHTVPFKLKPKIVAKYFKPGLKASEIEAVIVEALDFYYSKHNQ